MLKKSVYLLIATLLFSQLSLVGCAKKDTNLKTQNYANDGLLGTTNANPNFPTSSSFHTYASDKSLVLKALEPIKGIRNARIVFRGADLMVSLVLDPATDIESAMLIKYAALGSVSQMMPRYRVKVNVGKTS